MATYATTAELQAYVADNSDIDLPGDEDAQERLLERAQRRVDAVLGPYAPDPDSGLKLDPDALTDAQKSALSRATCAAAEHELSVGLDYFVSGFDYTPAGVAIVGALTRTSPRMVEELGGFGLVIRSGCAEPEPDAAA